MTKQHDGVTHQQANSRRTVVPLPEQMEHPLPLFLQKWQVVLLLEHWNLGSVRFYKKLKKSGVLKPVPLAHHDNHRDPRFATASVLNLYVKAEDILNQK